MLDFPGYLASRLDYLVAQDSQTYGHGQYYHSKFQIGGCKDVPFDLQFCVQFHAPVVHRDKQYYDRAGLAEDTAIVLVTVVERKLAYDVEQKPYRDEAVRNCDVGVVMGVSHKEPNDQPVKNAHRHIVARHQRALEFQVELAEMLVVSTEQQVENAQD